MFTDWPELRPAHWNGIECDAVAVGGDQSHATNVSEFPNRPGAEVIDLSRGAARFDLIVIFFGAKYANLALFQAALNRTGPGTLGHPLFGDIDNVVFGRISGPNADHSRRRFAEFRVEFIRDEPEGAKSLLLPTTTPQGRQETIITKMTQIKTAARDDLVTEAAQLQKTAKSKIRQAQETLRKIARQVRAWQILGRQISSGHYFPALMGILGQMDSAQGWLSDVGGWCETVDGSVLGGIRSALSGAGSLAGQLNLVRGELGYLWQTCQVIAGPLGGTAFGQSMFRFLRISGQAATVIGAMEVLMAGLAKAQGNPYQGPQIGIYAQVDTTTQGAAL